MQSLRAWLTAHDVHLDPRLDLVQRPADGGGCSVWANADVPDGVTVARIPKRLVLSHRSSSLSALLSPSNPLTRALHAAPPPLRLAVHVLHELRLGAASKWATYFAFCPPIAADDGPLAVPIGVLWDDDSDTKAWTRGTQLEKELRRAEINKQTLTSFYHSLVHPLLATLPPQFLAPSLPLFLHAYLLVSTRAFHVDSTGYHSLALVPLADVFNHEQEAVHNCQFVSDSWVCGECGAVGECEHDQDGSSIDAEALGGRGGSSEREKDDEDTCDLVSLLPISAGSEALNHYGPCLSNAKLVAEYGFMLEANEWDGVELEVGDVWEVVADEGQTRGEAVEERWRRLLDLSHRREELFEQDHPLLAPPDSDPAADPSLLSIDADARLSPALWLLLALVVSPSLSSVSNEAAAAEVAAMARSVRVLAERDAEEEDGEGDGESEEVSQEHLAVLGRVGELVDRLVVSRIRAQRASTLGGGDLLEMAEKEEDPATRLAVEFLAGERLLLERVQQNWAFP
ncbi:hypothetical protein JCM6882_000955 [Rhodosporidiobolus microsporus]